MAFTCCNPLMPRVLRKVLGSYQFATNSNHQRLSLRLLHLASSVKSLSGYCMDTGTIQTGEAHKANVKWKPPVYNMIHWLLGNAVCTADQIMHRRERKSRQDIHQRMALSVVLLRLLWDSLSHVSTSPQNGANQPTPALPAVSDGAVPPAVGS